MTTNINNIKTLVWFMFYCPEKHTCYGVKQNNNGSIFFKTETERKVKSLYSH